MAGLKKRFCSHARVVESWTAPVLECLDCGKVFDSVHGPRPPSLPPRERSKLGEYFQLKLFYLKAFLLKVFLKVIL